MSEKNYFIYVLKLLPEFQQEENWTDETNTIVGDHFNYLKDLLEKKQLVLAGRSAYEVDNPENFGVAIFSAANEEEARNLMNNDPSVKGKVMTATLHPFSLSLH